MFARDKSSHVVLFSDMLSWICIV